MWIRVTDMVVAVFTIVYVLGGTNIPFDVGYELSKFRKIYGLWPKCKPSVEIYTTAIIGKYCICMLKASDNGDDDDDAKAPWFEYYIFGEYELWWWTAAAAMRSRSDPVKQSKHIVANKAVCTCMWHVHRPSRARQQTKLHSLHETAQHAERCRKRKRKHFTKYETQTSSLNLCTNFSQLCVCCAVNGCSRKAAIYSFPIAVSFVSNVKKFCKLPASAAIVRWHWDTQRRHLNYIEGNTSSSYAIRNLSAKQTVNIQWLTSH